MARKIRLRWLVPLAALLALAIPATASATVTTSSITTPTGPLFQLHDGTPGQPAANITVSGTTDGTNTDTLDIKCYYGTTIRTLTTSVPVGSDGTFSYTGVINPLDYHTCILRAVPHGNTTDYPPDSDPSDDVFRGPVVAVSYYQGPPGTSFDANQGGFYAYDSQLQGAFDVVSAGGCGVYDSYVIDPVTLAISTELFWCNGGFFTSTGGPSDRPYIKVDDTPAYAPTADPESHYPGVNVNPTFDPATGQLTIQETDPIHFCSPGASTYPATVSSCTGGTPAGVSLSRTTVFDHNGRVATQSDQWSSTDGNAHALDVLYDQEFHSRTTNDNSFMFPGSSSFQRYGTGDTVSLGTASPGTFYIKGSDSASDGDETHPVGAVTYSSVPDNPVLFLTGSTLASPNSSPDLTMSYQRTVPATGTLDLAFRYSDAFTLSEVQGYAAEGEKAFTPPPPTPPTPPQTPPPPPPPPAPPAAPAAALPTIAITGAPSTKAVGVNILVNTGETVSCPTGGQPCTVTVLATSLVPSNLARTKRIVIGRTKFTIPAGQSRKITFKLNKKGAKALRKLTKLTVKLTVTARAGTGTPVTKVRTIKIKAPAKKRH